MFYPDRCLFLGVQFELAAHTSPSCIRKKHLMWNTKVGYGRYDFYTIFHWEWQNTEHLIPCHFFCTFSRAVAVCFQSEAKIHQVPDCATINFCPTWNDYPFLGERFETSKQIVTIQLDASKIHDDSPGKPLWVEYTSAKKINRQTWIISDHFPIVHDEHLCWNQCNSNPIPMNQFFLNIYFHREKWTHYQHPKKYKKYPRISQDSIDFSANALPRLPWCPVSLPRDAPRERFLRHWRQLRPHCIGRGEAGELQSTKTTNVKHYP